MTDQAFDALLRKALMEAVMEDLGPVWDGELPADPQSPRQRRRMLRLLRDPFGEVRRRARPVWKRGLRAAVCAVLISAALFAATIAAVPQARAWVKELWSQWFETHTKYEFTGDYTTIGDSWYPTYLPIGYTETFADEIYGDGQIEFANATGDIIYFMWTPVQEGTVFTIDNEHSKYSQIYLTNGVTADLYISNTIEKSNCLLWIDTSGKIGFQLIGPVTSQELVKMADSVTIKEK